MLRFASEHASKTIIDLENRVRNVRCRQWEFANFDMQSQALQAPYMMADDVLPVMLIEILIPQLTVWDFVTDDKVCGL